MTVTITGTPLLTAVRLALTAVLDSEFAAESFAFGPTKMTAGDAQYAPSAAVFSMGWQEADNINEVIARFGVQIFDQWGSDAVLDEQSYDPTLAERWAQRAVLALKANEHMAGVYWYLRVPTVALSDDQAGNPTQVELMVQVRTDNPFGF